MGRSFRLNTINSDLSDASDQLIPYVVTDEQGQPLQDSDGRTSLMNLRPITERHRRDVERKHTKTQPARNGVPSAEKTNWDDYRNELTEYAIVSWENILGADNKPLPCVYEAKAALQATMKNEIIKRAIEGEAVDDSFRPTP